jgi:hypothetical protein
MGGGRIAPAAPTDPGIAMGLTSPGSAASVPIQPPASAAVQSDVPPLPATNAATFNRFFKAAQNDFAARLKWSVTPNFRDANHEPTIRIKGPSEITAHPGSKVRLQAQVSDPDHNTVKLFWWQDKTAGTYQGALRFSSESSSVISFRVPNDATSSQSIHIVLEGTDNGTPPLTRYRRVVIQLK